MADFVTLHVAKTPETVGLIDKDLPGQGQAGHPHRQRGPGRHRRRGRAGRGRSASATSAAPRSTCSPRSRPPSRRCSSCPQVVVTPHLGRQHPRGAGQGGRHHRRAGRAGAGRRVRAVRGQRERGRGLRDGAPVPAAGRAARPALRGARRGPAEHARDRVPGPARRLRHPHPHAVGAEGRVRRRDRRAGVVRERPAHRGRAGRRGARHLDRHGPRLRQPDHDPRRRPRHRRHARRPAGRAPHRDARRPHDRPAAGQPHAGGAQRRPAGHDRLRVGRAGRRRRQHRRHAPRAVGPRARPPCR